MRTSFICTICTKCFLITQALCTTSTLTPSMVQSLQLYEVGSSHWRRRRRRSIIKWHQFISNDEISATTGFLSNPSLRPSDVITTPSINCQVYLSRGRPPSSQWHCHLGHPHYRCVSDAVSRSQVRYHPCSSIQYRPVAVRPTCIRYAGRPTSTAFP